MRVDMAQLVERSLPKPGVRSSTSHRQNFIINMFTANCWKDEKKEEIEAGSDQFFKRRKINKKP